MKEVFFGSDLLIYSDIMHRDLKPENILFRVPNDYSTVVIADLGLGTKVSLTEYLFVRCGTPGIFNKVCLTYYKDLWLLK